jgi:hypothetical protein
VKTIQPIHRYKALESRLNQLAHRGHFDPFSGRSFGEQAMFCDFAQWIADLLHFSSYACIISQREHTSVLSLDSALTHLDGAMTFQNFCPQAECDSWKKMRTKRVFKRACQFGRLSAANPTRTL